MDIMSMSFNNNDTVNTISSRGGSGCCRITITPKRSADNISVTTTTPTSVRFLADSSFNFSNIELVTPFSAKRKKVDNDNNNNNSSSRNNIVVADDDSLNIRNNSMSSPPVLFKVSDRFFVFELSDLEGKNARLLDPRSEEYPTTSNISEDNYDEVTSASGFSSNLLLLLAKSHQYCDKDDATNAILLGDFDLELFSLVEQLLKGRMQVSQLCLSYDDMQKLQSLLDYLHLDAITEVIRRIMLSPFPDFDAKYFISNGGCTPLSLAVDKNAPHEYRQCAEATMIRFSPRFVTITEYIPSIRKHPFEYVYTYERRSNSRLGNPTLYLEFRSMNCRETVTAIAPLPSSVDEADYDDDDDYNEHEGQFGDIDIAIKPPEKMQFTRASDWNYFLTAHMPDGKIEHAVLLTGGDTWLYNNKDFE